MVRLRSTPLLLMAAAGCTGQRVEGRWRGPFPLVRTRDCELRLMADHSATIACDGTATVGAGRYRWDGSRLTLEFSLLARAAHRVPPPAPFTFAIQGEGNAMWATLERETYEWKRIYL